MRHFHPIFLQFLRSPNKKRHFPALIFSIAAPSATLKPFSMFFGAKLPRKGTTSCSFRRNPQKLNQGWRFCRHPRKNSKIIPQKWRAGISLHCITIPFPLVRRTPQPYKSGRLGECLLELLSSMIMGVEQVVCLLTARLLQISLIQFLDDRILVRLSYEAFVIALVQRFCSLRA